MYDNNSNCKLKNKINIIASDGNWNYHKQIKCNYRKIVKIRKDKKDKRKWSRDDNGNLIRDIKNKYYNGFDENSINQNSSYDSCVNLITYYDYNFIHCNIHIAHSDTILPL
ncbi:MAG: hypothetical protein Ta2D_12470 [Rickettsiales bacterium]|nr:MAG: hypothetical protein Ta2D_12470 [Rickettsiales bacterium]